MPRFRPVRRTDSRSRSKLSLLHLEDRTVPATLGLADAGFELPSLGVGTFRYTPTGSPWTFSSGAGVTANGSGFTAGNPQAPEGSQVLFLQQKSQASQQAALAAGSYSLSFSAAQRGNLPSAQTLTVWVNDTVVGTFNNIVGTGYSTLTTSSFTLAAGLHSIRLQSTNLNGGDNTLFIDNLTLNRLDANSNDLGFEWTNLSPGTFLYSPTGQPWSFSAGAGVAANNSGFTAGNPAAPQGNQVAFLQRVAEMSESVGFVAGTYAIKFAAAQRANLPSSQTFQVLVDDQVVGTFNNLTGTAYTLLTTSTFTIGAGAHTVTFRSTNLNGGDNTVFIDQVSIERQATSLEDSGFESPALRAGQFQYSPTGSAWTFSGGAGLATNGSAFTIGNPVAPQGNQVLFLQRQSSASQSVGMSAGTYVLSFAAAQRGDRASTQTLQVLVDGNVVGTFNNVSGAGYVTFTTSSFTVADGQHTITLRGTNVNGGDNTILLDQVSLVRQSIPLADSGFEMPAVPTRDYAYAPSGSPWTFSVGAGIAANGSGFTAGNPDAPQGNQVLFLQRQSSASQTVRLPEGTYAISFSAAQRGNLPSTQTLQVLVDGNVVGTFSAIRGTSFVTYTTPAFVLAEGDHVITFRGTNANGGDNTIFIDQVGMVQPTSVISDAGFESPALAIGAFAYTPAGSPWTFNGTAGVAANGSGFTSGNPAAPQGNQVAVLQRLGSFSQSVNFVAGNYVIQFQAAQRSNLRSQQTFQVLVDGVVVGTFNNLASTNFVSLTTSTFSVTGGNHTITFRGTNLFGGDNTVLVDAITIQPM